MTTLPHSQIEIEGEIPVAIMEPYRKKAIAHLGEHIELPGFRKGKVPENLLISKVGEIGILEEAAELAFKEHIPDVFKANNIHPLGRPEILITKLVPGNPVAFKVKCAVLPEIKLADYKKIGSDVMAKKEEPLEVTEKEIQDVILNVRKSRAPKTEVKEKTEGKEAETKEELPEWNDAFVKTLGNFKDTADFTEKIKNNLLEEKKHRAKEKKRIEIGDRLVKETEADIPEVLIKSELNKMWAQFEADVARFGVKMDDYLKHAKKDKGSLEKEWRPDAEKNARLQLILARISEIEKIVPDEKSVEHEVEHIIEQYKDADPERARIYVETLLTNEAVFSFLENQK